MNGDEAAVAVIDALEAAGIPYMVVGSLASNVYGNPRSTQDADFILETTSALIVQLADRLGPPFRLDPQPSFDNGHDDDAVRHGSHRHPVQD